MKKICSIILAMILIITPILQVSAYDIINEKKIAVKNILLTKSQLKKITKGEQYITAMDNFIAKIKNNQKKLNSIEYKLSTAINNIKSKQGAGITLSKKDSNLLKILSYTQARITFIQLDNLQKIEETGKEKLTKILEQVKNPDISQLDKEKLEDTVIKIQKKLLDQSKLTVNNIMGDFEEYFNYENKGDFEMNFNSDHESIGKINAELKLSDYVTQTSNFDSRFNGNLTAMIEALPKGGEALKGEFNNFVEFIFKDGKYYALVKDLNIVSEENLEDFQEILDNLKDLAKENNYIEFSDDQSVEGIELIRYFHPDNFFKDADNLFSKSMFTAYKKEGDIYSIIPTKYACDTMKVLMNKFDPFSPDTCTNNQYRDIIEDIISKGELTMTLGNENILTYSQYPDYNIDKFDIVVSFTDSAIQKFTLNLLPNQTEYKDEGFHISYQKNKILNFNLYAEEGEYDIKFDSILDTRNNFSSITHSAYIQDGRDTYNLSINLQNKKINGDFIVETKKEKYNYQTSEYESIGTEYITANIYGNTNSRNELNNINLDYYGNDGEKNYLTGEIIYDLPRLKIVNNYQDDFGNIEFLFDGKWNTKNNNFDNFSTAADVSQKDRKYNNETYQYEYTQEEAKIFDMKYTLSNGDIKGTLNTYDNKVLVLGIVTNGSYEKDKLELDNIINANFINSMFGYAKNTRNSKRVSDLSNLSKMTEMYITKNGMLPSSESFWEEMGINKDDFQDPIANVEINGCKFGYTYAKGNNSYQFSSCTEGSDIKITKGNYYEGKDDKLANREYLEGYTAWGKQDTQEKETPIININLIYDSVGNNFNQNLYLDTIYEGETIFEFNMKNIGIIEYKKIDIQTPTNTVPFEEVFETNNNY